MRPLTPDRPATTTLRLGLVLMVAFMLVLTRLPLAQAQDPSGEDGASAAVDPVDESTETPAEGPGEPPAPPAGEPTEGGDDDVVVDDGASEAPVSDDGEAPVVDDSTEPAEDTGDETASDESTEAPVTAAAAEEEVTAAAAPDGGDFSIDWVAAHPQTYNHITGSGGTYGTGSNATTVESLNSGDFRCGEQVVYFAAITADPGATDASEVTINTSFEGLTTGQPGIGHETVVGVSVQEGTGDGVSLVGWSEGSSGSTVTASVTLGDFEGGEFVVVKYRVRLGCPTGSPEGGTGVIHASLTSARVTSPGNSTINTGNQTIPFKQSGSIPRGDLTVTKVVEGTQPPNTQYVVTVVCDLGITDTLTFNGSGTQTIAQIPQTDTCTVTETQDGGADRTTVKVNNGAVQTGKTADIVIGAGTNNVTFTNTFFAPDMSLTKSASVTEVVPGGGITYTVTATNASTSQVVARGVTITDDLDDNLQNVSASVRVDGGPATNCTVAAGNEISCTVGELGIGKSAVMTVTATATDASCNDVLLNTATVAGSNFASEDSNRVSVEVVCDPDLRLTKVASQDSVDAGEQYSYTIRATNPASATAAAEGVHITDTLPAGLTIDDATYRIGNGSETDCAVSGQAVDCNVGTIGIGQVATVTITVTPTATACPEVVNRAAATGSNFPAEQSNQVTVDVICTPALTIAKTASEANLVPGQSYEYEITVVSPNSATAPSEDVVITDNLHDGLDVDRPTFSVNNGADQNCDAVGTGNTIRCAVGDLDPGDSVVVTVPVTATRDSCGPITNVATAAATNLANSIGSNQVTVNVSCTPDLMLRKSASSATVQSGDPITYTIEVENPATATLPAEDVVVTDDLDDDLTGVSASYTIGTTPRTCAVNSLNGVRCDIGDIGIGETITITITATTTEAACGQVLNTSVANGSNFSTVTSNQVSVTVVCPADMTITKSASTGTVRPGDDFTYTLTATNAASAGQAAKNVVITDDVDNTLTGVDAEYRVGAGALQSCTTGANNLVTCNVGDLAVGASVTVTISATAAPASCGAVRNVSSAAGTNFTTVVSNEVTVNVECSPALGLRKFASAGTVQAGSPITYTIEASNPNTATRAAEDVIITDNLHDALTNVTARVTSGGVTTNCAVTTGNAVSCNAGDIAIGGVATVTITATTTNAACGVIDNRATADGSNFGPVSSNTATVNVECPAVMSITKSASTGSVTQGQAYTYTITATNAASAGQAARNVVITDNLDDRLTGVSASYRVAGGTATACDAPGSGNTIRCAVGTLAVGTSVVVTINVTAPANSCETLRNVSTASGSNFTSVTSRQVEVDISCDVDTDEPSIRLEKTGTVTDPVLGEDILYTYVITNTGNVTLTQVDLVDDVLGVLTVADTTLSPGESTRATATHEITQADVNRGNVTNVAVTTGKTPNNTTVRDTDDEVVQIPGTPGISMTKVPNVDAARVGDVVEYTYVITNIGATTLTDITLNDDKIGTIVAVSDRVTLAPGARHTVTVEYTVVEDDVTTTNPPEVVNVAVATGLPPSGPPVSTTATARVRVPIETPATLLQVVKRVAGDTTPPTGSQFGFSVDCGDVTFAGGGTFTLPEDGGTYDVGRLPVGQDCTVEETRDAGATSTTVAVGTAPAVAGTVAEFTTVEGVTTVTFVNTFNTRPITPECPDTNPACAPPPPPPPPDLPATGVNLMVQLLLGLGALALGSSVLSRFQPAAEGTSRRRRRSGWFRS